MRHVDGSHAALCRHAATEDGLTQQCRALSPPGRVGLRLPRPAGTADHRCRRDRADQVGGDPSCVGGRVDLAVPQRAHPGSGHRRRGPAPVPLPPRLADQARPDEVRPRPGGSAEAPGGAQVDHPRPGARGDAAGAGGRGRRTAAGPGVLPDRQRRVRRQQRQLRAHHAGEAPRAQGAGQAGLPLRGQVRHRAQRGDRRPRGAGRAGQPATPARGHRAAARLPGEASLARPGLRGRQPLPQRSARRAHGQGLPDLARDGARGRGARGLRGARRHEGVAGAGR